MSDRALSWLDARPAALVPSRADGSGAGTIAFAGASLVLDPAGALYWPDESAVVVADLHLEKGSSFAARGVLLPPYDTAATLSRLGDVIARYAPRLVVALGDSFHDRRGAARLTAADRSAIQALQHGRDWLWVAGNHDPDLNDGSPSATALGGRFAATLALGGLTFRHAPLPGGAGEIAGHLHPVAQVATRGRVVSRRCFAADAQRLVLPAFGAYAGGLNVRDAAFAVLFGPTFVAHLLGERRVYAVPGARCLAG